MGPPFGGERFKSDSLAYSIIIHEIYIFIKGILRDRSLRRESIDSPYIRFLAPGGCFFFIDKSGYHFYYASKYVII